jgi:hypothetical protein
VDNKTTLVLGFLFYNLSKRTVEQILSDVEASARSAQSTNDAYMLEMYAVLLDAVRSELSCKVEREEHCYGE